MARKLRVQYPGAIYHVLSRGDRRKPAFKDHRDRERFLETLGEAYAKTGWEVRAYCLMPNHFHLVKMGCRTTGGGELDLRFKPARREENHQTACKTRIEHMRSVKSENRPLYAPFTNGNLRSGTMKCLAAG